jgi:4-amino-4-deoxy-L-arabinose transferase-like glycosyltransferase
MKQNTSSFDTRNLPPLLFPVLLLLSAAYLLAYFWMVIQRMPYPFELEWMEGGMADQVRRIVSGEPVYTAPSIRFVAFVYPPLYFYLSALASLLFGGGLVPLRIVSFAASLVSFTLIFSIVKRISGDWRTGLVSAGLFAASFRATGAWLDIGRVDSLFTALWLAFIAVVVRQRRAPTSAILCGILAALAVLTKQSALIALLPVFAYLFARNWKQALAMSGTAVAIVGAVTIAFQQASGGWYSFYVYELLSQQTEWIPSLFVRFWTDDLLTHVPLAILFVIFFLAAKFRDDKNGFFLWLSIAVGGLAAAFLTRVKLGGYHNVLLPLFAVLSILFGLGLHAVLRTAESASLEFRKRIGGLVLVACLMQLAMLAFDPRDQAPTQADKESGGRLLRHLASIPGEVYVADHGYICTLAGKRSYAHHAAIWDVMRGERDTRGKSILKAELDNAIRHQAFDLIILDSDWNYISKELTTYYSREADFFPESDAFYPVTGGKRRPTQMYVPRRMP